MRRQQLIAVLFFGGILSVSLFIYNKSLVKDQIANNNDQKFYSNLLPESSSNEVHHESYYSYSYLKEHELSEWTIYLSTKSRLLDSAIVARSSDFKENPNIFASISNKDYRGSGYDRGHLVPAADMSFNSTAMHECFYYTNSAPQTSSLNRGIWKKLESKVREWTIEYDSLIIITGCIFKDSLNYKTPKIGKVSVPAFYYKIIIDMQRMSSIAFAIPNYPKENELISYVYSIHDLEQVTGTDFFYKLPDSVETVLEYKEQDLAIEAKELEEERENPEGVIVADKKTNIKEEVVYKAPVYPKIAGGEDINNNRIIVIEKKKLLDAGGFVLDTFGAPKYTILDYTFTGMCKGDKLIINANKERWTKERNIVKDSKSGGKFERRMIDFIKSANLGSTIKISNSIAYRLGSETESIIPEEDLVARPSYSLAKFPQRIQLDPFYIKIADEDEIFDHVSDPPSFPGGNKALFQWIEKNIEYPSIAKEYGITGRVFVKFIVEKNGSISNVRVAREVDKQLDKEAIRVVSMLPNFNPGMQNGRLVRVNYIVPINFTLD